MDKDHYIKFYKRKEEWKNSKQAQSIARSIGVIIEVIYDFFFFPSLPDLKPAFWVPFLYQTK